MVFGEFRCNAYGFRLYKSVANTPEEVQHARHFQTVAAPKGDPDPQTQPTIFCRTSPGHAYFLDLYFFWRDVKPLTHTELHDYAGWAHRYAHAHGCRVFFPKQAS
jgi:hypothetical protein